MFDSIRLTSAGSLEAQLVKRLESIDGVEELTIRSKGLSQEEADRNRTVLNYRKQRKNAKRQLAELRGERKVQPTPFRAVTT